MLDDFAREDDVFEAIDRKVVIFKGFCAVLRDDVVERADKVSEFGNGR